MYAYRFRAAAIAVLATLGLSACVTPYGYGGVSVGGGNGYYGSDYGYGYGGGYPGYGYGGGYPGYGYSAGYPGYGLGYAPYWGWYDDFYYPGTGYYVYDAYRQPHRWTDAQRRYWSDRRERASQTTSAGQQVVIRENWNDFSRKPAAVRPTRVNRSVERPNRVERSTRPARVERSVERPARVERSTGPARVERSASQSEPGHKASLRHERRLEARSAQTSEERESRSDARARKNIREE